MMLKLTNLIGFGAASGARAPAFINSNLQTIAGSSATFSHTTTSDTTLLVVLIEGFDNASGSVPTISDVTFDGVSLTAGPAALASNGNNDMRVAIYYMLNPAITTANIVVTANIALAGRIQAVNVSGGEPALDASGSDNTLTGGTTLSVSLVTSKRTIQFGATSYIRAGAPTITWSADVTEMVDESPATNTQVGAGRRDGPAAETYDFQSIASASSIVGALAAIAFR